MSDTPENTNTASLPIATSSMRDTIRQVNAHIAQAQSIQLTGISGSITNLLSAGIVDGLLNKPEALKRHLVIIVPSIRDLGSWSAFVERTLPTILPSSDVRPPFAVIPAITPWGADRFVNAAVHRKQRLYGLSLLAEAKAPAIVLTTLAGLSQTTLPVDEFKNVGITLSEGSEWDPDALVEKLLDLGFRPSAQAMEEGSLVLRGGILDVYPMNATLPIRIEFIGDQIGSLRYFSPESQRSISAISQVQINVASEAFTPRVRRKEVAQRLYEFLLEQPGSQQEREGIISSCAEGLRFPGYDALLPVLRGNEGTGWDYLSQAVLMFPTGIDPCLESYKETLAAVQAGYQKDIENQRPTCSVERHFLSLATAEEKIRHSTAIECGNPIRRPYTASIRLTSRTTIDAAPAPSKDQGEVFDKWLDRILTQTKKEQKPVAIFAHTTEQLERAAHLFEHRGIPTTIQTNLLKPLMQGELTAGQVYLGIGDFGHHFWIAEDQLLVIPEAILFGSARRQNKPASAKLQNLLSSFRDLKVGDMVVHVQHGIGQYEGLTSFEVGGTRGDFLILEYSGGDRIYVPVDRLGMIQRYSGGTEGAAAHPSMDKLRSGSWEKRKGRVKKAVKDMAEELLKIAARRNIAEGHQCSAPGDMYFQFEAEFPFEETEDQARAIADVNADLSSERAMDRLICGDVGFGKTEVALRATYRMVLDGFQVLVLVPTTVLCYQHYRTFLSRLGIHGVRVAQVNRFATATEMKEAVKGIQDGTVDVLVGTHRLLSQDIKPRRLGLLIVDEEQRFGVSHKERLKTIRAGAHVLTLSATPIPRTLHMAMLGLREISIIATPPQDRLAVKTAIARFDESLIREAIQTEIGRGGQVFVVHNRVEDIAEFTLYLKSLIPGVDMRFAHGQMSEHQLEKAIVDFLEQRFAVLVCTSIIESGVDMPNVNTLIVDRADRFGLAQLYQLKGRVGRSSEQAYAYFLTPGDERLSEEAQKRLEVLSTHQELGAGFQIASYDLELRGTGNLLGAEQSGHASEVGLEMYTHMLETAIHEIRGEPVKEKVDTELRLNITALISATYIAQENLRLHTYKRLFSADLDSDIKLVEEDVRDRFGPPPTEFIRLTLLARVKRRLKILGAASISSQDNVFEIRFGSLTPEQIASISDAAKRQPKEFKLSPDYRLQIYTRKPTDPKRDAEEQRLEGLLRALDPLVQNLAP